MSVSYVVVLLPAFLSVTNCYVTYIAARLPLQGEVAPPGSPWPMPAEWIRDSEVMTLDPTSFTMTSNRAGCDIISSALKRYQRLLFIDGKAKADSRLAHVGKLNVEIQDQDCPHLPNLTMDESYNLTVKKEASLKTQTVWGALRGLETFSQLVHIVENKYRMNKTVIKDRPRFPHRGSHVDTARHYLPMPILKRHLDAMAYNKMNVLHWHVVDDQSFPFVSKTFPELSQQAAFSPKHVYKPSDVSDIIEYARMRGIRVIPEFDSPGHAQAWGKSHRELLTECWSKESPGKAVYGSHAAYENFDPTQNSTYTFLSQFLAEVKEVFPDDFVHMGLDEAHYMCWESSPNISAFMKSQGFGPDEYYKLEQYYVERALDVIAETGRKYIIWQDPVDHGVQADPEAIIEVWKKPWEDFMANVTASGYQTLLSSCWYLNYISYGADWKNYYLCDPLNFNGTDEAKARVLGGEACMWAEFVDGTNMLQRYWPRACAVAERLWSPAEINDADSATFRLDQQRCRMVRRGIPAEPINPGYCGDYDYGFDLDMPQDSDVRSTCSEISSSDKLFSFCEQLVVMILMQLILFVNI